MWAAVTIKVYFECYIHPSRVLSFEMSTVTGDVIRHLSVYWRDRDETASSHIQSLIRQVDSQTHVVSASLCHFSDRLTDWYQARSQPHSITL